MHHTSYEVGLHHISKAEARNKFIKNEDNDSPYRWRKHGWQLDRRHITYHTSYIMYHIPCIIYHIPYVTYHTMVHHHHISYIISKFGWHLVWRTPHAWLVARQSMSTWLLEWLPKWCCFPVRAYCSLLFISFIYSVLCPWSPTLCTALWTQLKSQVLTAMKYEVLAVRTCTVTADPWKLSCENVSPSQNVTIAIMLPHGHKNAFQFVYLYLILHAHHISPRNSTVS